MLIDWFTVGAQIVNFLVLVWLLKRFLYGRILRAIDMRESKIATRLAEADAKEKAADEQFALYQARLQEFQQQREGMLEKARLEADKQQAEMLARAREQVHSLETKWQQELDRERKTFFLDLRRRGAMAILAITRRTVADLACLDVQQCAIQVFLERIRSLDHDVREVLARGPACIRSAFEIPEETRAEIRQTLEDQLRTPISLQFERAPGLGLGVELRANGWRIGWNSESYLETLEEDLKAALEHDTRVP